jgi:pyruvate,water dikinase
VSGPECAGVHTSFTGVVGLAQVVSRIHGCWASLFGERALSMRARGLGADEPTMAVVVQRMVLADKSGLAVPLDSSSDLLVEATFGLGEPIISGAVEPDQYVIDRATSIPTSVTIGHKRVVLEGDAGHAFMPSSRQQERVLDDSELERVGLLSSSIDDHFGAPHEIEWALRDDALKVLQIRPFTPHRPVPAPSIERTISGVGIGLGFATGRVRVVHRPVDLAELQAGDILVTSATTPEWTPHLERAGAVITDDGDTTCHAARVARELGIPAIVGTGTATTMLDDGRYVTVDAARGWVLPAVTLDAE